MVQAKIGALQGILTSALIANTQNMPWSGDCRGTIICRELMLAGNLDNIIAILILSKNTSGVKNFLHNTLLFQLNSAMLQYSLANHTRTKCAQRSGNLLIKKTSKTSNKSYSKCLSAHKN
jgi:hypothetical protein